MGNTPAETSKSQTAGTLGNYYERVFTTGLLRFPETANFDQLDADDHLDIFQDSIDRLEIGHSRQLDILSTWSWVYTFAASRGYISKTIHIDLDGALYETRRPFLLSPFDFDKCFEDTWQKARGNTGPLPFFTPSIFTVAFVPTKLRS